MARKPQEMPIEIIEWDRKRHERKQEQDEANRQLRIEAPMPYWPEEERKPERDRGWENNY